MIDVKEQYDLVDKSSWRDGIWKQEPDRVSWIDPETGYHCLVRRNPDGGFLCGYVAVEKVHPFYLKTYQDNDYHIQRNLEAHGGLTYSAECDGDGVTGICHVTKDEDKAWWFGFDCGHAWDTMPAIELPKLSGRLEIHSMAMNGMEIYRDLAYCTEEVESLAKQLKQVEVEGFRKCQKKI